MILHGVTIAERRHSHILQQPLVAPRGGIMLHYDDSSRDDWALDWFADQRCTNGYTWVVLDDGRIIELADPGMRTPHAGPCRTPIANSHFSWYRGHHQRARARHRGTTHGDRATLGRTVQASPVGPLHSGAHGPPCGARCAGHLDQVDHDERHTLGQDGPQGRPHGHAPGPTTRDRHRGDPAARGRAVHVTLTLTRGILCPCERRSLGLSSS